MNWAWPHTPASYLARIVLADGPFAGEEAAFVPPDTASPVQVVWSGWIPALGFAAYLYEWRGGTTTDRGRTDALLFRCIRRVALAEIPPAVAESGELWAAAPAMIACAFGVPPELIWPGL